MMRNNLQHLIRHQMLVFAALVCQSASRNLNGDVQCARSTVYTVPTDWKNIRCSECDLLEKEPRENLDGHPTSVRRALMCSQQVSVQYSARHAVLNLTSVVDLPYPVVVFANFTLPFHVHASPRTKTAQHQAVKILRFSRIISLDFKTITSLYANWTSVRIEHTLNVTFPSRIFLKDILLSNVSAYYFPVHLTRYVPRIETNGGCRFVEFSCNVPLGPGTEHVNGGESTTGNLVKVVDTGITSIKACAGRRTRFWKLAFVNSRIGTIHTEAFKNVSIQNLKIDNSHIGKIEKEGFGGLVFEESFSFLENNVITIEADAFRGIETAPNKATVEGWKYANLSISGSKFGSSQISSFDVQVQDSLHPEFNNNDARIGCKCDDLRKFQQVPKGAWRPAIIEFQCTNDSIQHVPAAKRQMVTPYTALCSSCGKFAGTSLADLSCSLTVHEMTCKFQQKPSSAEYGEVASNQQSFLLRLLVEHATSCGRPYLIIENAHELTINASVLNSVFTGNRIRLKLVRVHNLTILELPNNPPCCKKIEFTEIRHLQIGPRSVTQHHTTNPLGAGSAELGDGTVNYLSLSSDDKRLKALCCDGEVEMGFDGNVKSVQTLLDQCSLHCQARRNDEKEGQAIQCHPVTGEARTNEIGNEEVWICELQNEKGIGHNAFIRSLELPSASENSRIVIVGDTTKANRMTIGSNALANLTTDRLEFDSISDLRLEDGSLVTATSNTTTVIRNSVVTKFGNVHALGRDQVQGKCRPGPCGKPSLHFENSRVNALIPSSIFSQTETFIAKKSFISGFGEPIASAVFKDTGHSLMSEQNLRVFNTSRERLQQTISIQESNISSIYQLGIVAEQVCTFEILNSEIGFVNTHGILLTTARNFIFQDNRFGQLVPAAIQAKVARKIRIENNTFKSSRTRFAFGLETQLETEVIALSNIVEGSSPEAGCVCDSLDYHDDRDNNHEAKFGFPLRAFNLNLSCRYQSKMPGTESAGWNLINAEAFYKTHCTGSLSILKWFIPLAMVVLLACLCVLSAVILRIRRRSKPGRREDDDIPTIKVTRSSRAGHNSLTLTTEVHENGGDQESERGDDVENNIYESLENVSAMPEDPRPAGETGGLASLTVHRSACVPTPYNVTRMRSETVRTDMDKKPTTQEQQMTQLPEEDPYRDECENDFYEPASAAGVDREAYFCGKKEQPQLNENQVPRGVEEEPVYEEPTEVTAEENYH